MTYKDAVVLDEMCRMACVEMHAVGMQQWDKWNEHVELEVQWRGVFAATLFLPQLEKIQK